jgi:hypothetical protein
MYSPQRLRGLRFREKHKESNVGRALARQFSTLDIVAINDDLQGSARISPPLIARSRFIG